MWQAACIENKEITAKKLDLLRKAFAWKGHYKELKGVEPGELVQKAEAVEALMCARVACKAAIPEAGGGNLTEWVQKLPSKTLDDHTDDLSSKTVASLCELLVDHNARLAAALEKVEPWKSELKEEDAASITKKDLLALAATLLKGPDAQVLHQSFKSAKQERPEVSRLLMKEAES